MEEEALKLWIISDLHQDFGRFDIDPPADADIAVIAGDVVNDEFLLRLAERMPVVFVAGNHDFYRHCHLERLGQLRDLMHQGSPFYFLENTTLLFGGVRFLGCTLWTDYNRGNPLAMDLAGRSMNDHRKIAWQKQPVWQRFRPEEAQKLHNQSRNWLSERFSQRFAGKTVVITHHAPSARSVAPKFAGNPLNHAYFSDLEAEILRWRPDVWVHGHMHTCFDYAVGETRVICNPHGYPRENPHFNSRLVVEI